AAAADLAPEVIAEIQQLAAGNPFFALELARAASRGEDGVRVSIPRELSETLRDRLERLPQRAREAVVAASSTAQPTLSQLEELGYASDDLAAAVAAEVV